MSFLMGIGKSLGRVFRPREKASCSVLSLYIFEPVPNPKRWKRTLRILQKRNVQRSIEKKVRRVGLMVSAGARLPFEWSGFEVWPGTLCCVLRLDTLPSQCLSPPKCLNEYRRICCGVTLRWNSISSRGRGGGGVEALLHATETVVKHRSDGPLGS